MNTQQIKQQLESRFAPCQLELIDESHKHIGHPGAASGGKHYRLLIYSPHFQSLGKLACHRLIYETLDEAMGKAIHALSIKILSEPF